jgi:hypothetical protein
MAREPPTTGNTGKAVNQAVMKKKKKVGKANS